MVWVCYNIVRVPAGTHAVFCTVYILDIVYYLIWTAPKLTTWQTSHTTKGLASSTLCIHLTPPQGEVKGVNNFTCTDVCLNRC